jgi:hypothetical protein
MNARTVKTMQEHRAFGSDLSLPSESQTVRTGDYLLQLPHYTKEGNDSGGKMNL